MNTIIEQPTLNFKTLKAIHYADFFGMKYFDTTK